MLRNAVISLIERLTPGIGTRLREARQLWRDRRMRQLEHRLSKDRPLNQLVVGARGRLDDCVAYLHRRGLMKCVGVEPEPAEARRLLASGEWDAILPYALGACTF